MTDFAANLFWGEKVLRKLSPPHRIAQCCRFDEARPSSNDASRPPPSRRTPPRASGGASRSFKPRSPDSPSYSRNCQTSTATEAEPGDLPGLLAWHIVLIVAQPGRKRDPDASAGEPPAFGKIVEDHFSRVFV